MKKEIKEQARDLAVLIGGLLLITAGGGLMAMLLAMGARAIGKMALG